MRCMYAFMYVFDINFFKFAIGINFVISYSHLFLYIIVLLLSRSTFTCSFPKAYSCCKFVYLSKDILFIKQYTFHQHVAFIATGRCYVLRIDMN